MTTLRRTLVLLLIAASAAAWAAQPSAGDGPRVAVVVNAGDRAAVTRAEAVAAAAHGADVALRVPRTPTEQLQVTHLLAVAGYDAVVEVGLDRRIAIEPVARRYPGVRFIAADQATLAAAVRNYLYR
jgi:basic membrane lipoprotein Med (substrate-binding protein (PBP1-ABC) superfamily)